MMERLIIHNGRLSYQIVIGGRFVRPIDFIRENASKLGFDVVEEGDGNYDYGEKTEGVKNTYG